MKKLLLSVLGLFGIVSAASAADYATGTAENPLSVDDIINQGVPSTPVTNTYVKGYIVGYVASGEGTSYANDCHFEIDEASVNDYNVLMASSSTEDNKDYIIPVQLMGDARNNVGLKSNPGNLGKQITVLGTHTKYFGVNAIKEVQKYAFGNDIIQGGSTDDLPEIVTSLNEEFASIPANWKNIALEGDKTFYVKTFNNNPYAAASGYQGTAPFNIWLISPGIDIAKCDSKVLTFDTQVNLYGSSTSTFEVYVLDGNDPATAKATKLNCTLATAPESGWSDWAKSGDIDLSSYSGTIYIGFNYKATEDANYATWGLDNVKLNATDTPTPPVGDQGTAEKPLTIAELTANEAPARDQGIAGWYVEGYIVGYVPDRDYKETVFGTPGADVTAELTNLVLGPTADSKDLGACIPVQLPKGDIRTKLNLFTNPGNLGKKVVLGGTYEIYFGTNGLRKVTYAQFGSEQPGNAIYAGLENNADGWTLNEGFKAAEGLDYVWVWDSRYGLKASAYVSGTSFAQDVWAISPVIDLTNATEPELAFSQAANFFKGTYPTNALTQVRVEGGEWKSVDLQTVPDTDSWNFVDSSASLADFAGKKIQIGFRYISSDQIAGTWEIKNLKVTGKTTDTGIESVLLGEGEATYFNLQGVRVANPENGIFIKVQNGKSTKVIR